MMGRQRFKIAFVDHLPFIGGAQLVLKNHIKYLDKTKFEVFLVTDKTSKLTDMFDLDKDHIVKINFGHLKEININSIKHLYSSLRQFNHVLKTIEPDILVSNTARAFVLVGLCSYKGAKVAFIRDYEYPKLIFNLLKSRFERLLFVSYDVQSHFQQQKKSDVIYVPSDLGEKVDKVSEKEAFLFRQSLGIEDDQRLIGFVGRLVDWKGPLTLVKAMLSLPSDFKAVLVGTGKGQEGNIEEQLTDDILDKGLEGRVIMTGFMENIALVFKSLDVFVLTSEKPEPFATTVVSAAQAKIPIIATNIGGTVEFIKPGETGLLYEPGNAIQLEEQILKMFSDKKLKNKLVYNAYSRAQAFTEEKINSQLELIYLSLVT